MARLRLLDALSAAGSASRPNDDAWGCGAGLAFVFDGATSVADAPLLPGDSDAAWIAQAGRDALLATSEGATLRERVGAAVAAVAARFDAERRRDVGERHNYPSAALCVLDGREAGVFADCAAVVRHADGAVAVVAPPSAVKSTERDRAVAARRLSPAESLARQRAFRRNMNRVEGYDVFAPDPDCAARLRVAPLGLARGALVLVMSDGFYALVEDYGAFDPAGLIAAAEAGGLAPLLAQLRAVEAADAACERYPRFKTSDDATAILAVLE